MDIAFLITAFATLFVIIDPIGLTPIFVALTTGMSPQQRRQVALRCCLIAVGILLAFGLFGEALLGFVGIGMPAFRISGGVLLFITALDMLFERRQSRRKDQAEEEHVDDPSVFPMAIPLIAGPGSIATIILLTGDQDWMGFVAVHTGHDQRYHLCVLPVSVRGRHRARIGKTGVNIVTRLLGMLLAALSVQFILDGLRDFGIGLI